MSFFSFYPAIEQNTCLPAYITDTTSILKNKYRRSAPYVSTSAFICVHLRSSAVEKNPPKRPITNISYGMILAYGLISILYNATSPYIYQLVNLCEEKTGITGLYHPDLLRNIAKF